MKTNIFIEAVAGSGKTTTMLLRMVYLIKKHGFSAKNFLILTFNIRTCKMIQERLRSFKASFSELDLKHVKCYNLDKLMYDIYQKSMKNSVNHENK